MRLAEATLAMRILEDVSLATRQAMPLELQRVYTQLELQRVYTQFDLDIRRMAKKRLPSRTKESLHSMSFLTTYDRSMDFMFDRLTNSRSFRTLNDNFEG
jgi:putative transposase